MSASAACVAPTPAAATPRRARSSRTARGTPMNTARRRRGVARTLDVGDEGPCTELSRCQAFKGRGVCSVVSPAPRPATYSTLKLYTPKNLMADADGADAPLTPRFCGVLDDRGLDISAAAREYAVKGSFLWSVDLYAMMSSSTFDGRCSRCNCCSKEVVIG